MRQVRPSVHSEHRVEQGLDGSDDVRHGHARPLGGKHLGNGPANASTGSRDRGNFGVEIDSVRVNHGYARCTQPIALRPCSAARRANSAFRLAAARLRVYRVTLSNTNEAPAPAHLGNLVDNCATL